MINSSSKQRVFSSLIYSPSSTIPLLSDDDIHTIILEAISSYVDDELDFQSLVEISTNIKLFSGIREKANEAVNNALTKTSSLSKFIDHEQQKKHEIRASLADILDNLAEK